MNRNIFFTCLIVLFLFFTVVGYSELSKNLSVDGDAYLRVNLDLRIKGIKVDSTTNDATTSRVRYTQNTTGMNVSLPEVGSSVTYLVSIKNSTGKYFTINIDSVSGLSSGIKYELIDLENYGVYQGSTYNFKLRVYATEANQVSNITFNYFLDTVVSSYSFPHKVGYYDIPARNAYYKIELWGAQGGDANNSATGGKGAYTSGTVKLNHTGSLYFYVGGRGTMSSLSGTGTLAVTDGGYNGGGNTANQPKCCSERYWGAGGGATDVRLVSGTWDNVDSLKSRIMVAAGGGGAFSGISGGAGGALEGIKPKKNNGYGPGSGGTQTTGGTFFDWKNENTNLSNNADGGFGFGGYNTFRNSSCSGGGSGYYGGSGSYHIDAAGGGSSFISGYLGCVSIKNETGIVHKCTESAAKSNVECSKHYSNNVFTEMTMVDGEHSMPNSNGTNSSVVGNSGDGYARVTIYPLNR